MLASERNQTAPSRRAGIIRYTRIYALPLAVLVLAGLALTACKEDCSGPARMGDFEFSQGNYVNAVKHYEKALKADAKCGVVGEKLAEAKRKVAAGK